MKVTTLGTSVDDGVYTRINVLVFVFTCLTICGLHASSPEQHRKKSDGCTTSDESQQQSWVSYSKSFPLTCTVFALFCIGCIFGKGLYDNPVQNTVPSKINQQQKR